MNTRQKMTARSAMGRSKFVRCGFLIFVALLASDAPAQDQPKKYDLKLNWKAVEGYKSEVSQDVSQTAQISFSADGKVLHNEDKTDLTSLLATEVVTNVKDDKPTGLRWTFSKATQHHENKDIPYAFQGKTVVVTTDADGRRSFVYENGEALAPEDVAVLNKFHGDDKKKPDEPSGAEIFAPKHPVAVGESWTPDIELIARLLGSDMAGAIDISKSTAQGTLKSATTTDGVDTGQIEMTVDLYITKFGPMQLDEPIPMKFVVNVEGCIDGKRPDGAMTMKMELKGERQGSMPNVPGKLNLAVDMQMTNLLRQHTIN